MIYYFQSFYLFTRALPFWTDDDPFPVAIDSDVKDVLFSLRPKLKPFNTIQEVEDSMDKLVNVMNNLSKTVSLFHRHLKFAFSLPLFSI